MEYPKLYERLERQKETLEKEIASVRKRLDTALAILEKHHKAETGKKADFEAAESLKAIDPKAAEALTEKKKLDVTRNRVRSKEALRDQLLAQINELDAEKATLALSAVDLKNFNPLAEQLANPALRSDFEFSKKPQHRPNSLFKTFEGHFTPPRYRLQPKPDGRYAHERWNRFPLEACIVDPSLIPDWLVEDFGLAEWEDDLSEVQKLMRKKDAIPTLVGLFRHLTPLNRFSRNGEPIPNPRFLAIDSFSPLHDGKLFYSRYQGRKEESTDSKMLQVYDSAYDAMRMTSHASRRYQSEMVQLSSSELKIESLQRQLVTLRKADPDYEPKKEALRTTLAQETERLQHTTNYFKRSAFQTLQPKAGLKDSLGRENLGAACASLLKAIRFLRARRPQIFNKTQFGQEDRQTLETAINDSESLLELHFGQWDEIASRLPGMGSAAVFNGCPEEKLGSQRENLTRALFSTLDCLKTLHSLPPVRPFLQYSQHLEALTLGVKKAIKDRDHALAISESRKAAALGTLFRAQKGVEEMIRTISLYPTAHLGQLAQKAKLVSDTLKANPFFSEGSAYSTSKDFILGTLAEFSKELDDVLKKNPGADELAEVVAPLKAKLETIDFVFLLGSLD